MPTKEDITAKPKTGLKTTVMTLGAIALIVFSINQLTNTYTNFHPSSMNLMTVTGEGKQKAVPDTAIITLGVTTVAATAEAAQKESDSKTNKIIEFVKSQGIDAADIRTSYYNLYPNQDYSGGKNVITGYSANQTLDIKVKGVDKDTANLSKILSGSTQNGANQVQNVQLTFDNPTEARAKAKEQAINDARTKAAAQAKAAGLKLGKIYSITENGAGYNPIPYNGFSSAKGMGGGGGDQANIQPGEQELVESITVTFEIK